MAVFNNNAKHPCTNTFLRKTHHIIYITGVFTLHDTHITGIVTPHDIAFTDVVTPHDILQVLLKIIMVLIKQYIKFNDGMWEQFLFC